MFIKKNVLIRENQIGPNLVQPAHLKLSHNINYQTLDSEGLSLCGLALCKKDNHFLEEARQAYAEARKINSDEGYVKRLLRLLDKLAEVLKR